MNGIALLLLGVMILWAVYNWKLEFDKLKDAINLKNRLSFSTRFWYAMSLPMDIFLTGAAVAMLGLGGLYGAVGGLFMSNIISIVFFTRRG